MSEVKNVNDSSVKKVRKTKNVKEGPVRAKSGYLMFCVENRPIVVAENPSITNTDIVTELAKRWQEVKTAGGAELQKYVDFARVDKERYEQEKLQFDGNKSSLNEVVVEAPPAPKKKAAPRKKKDPVPEPVSEHEPAPQPEVVQEEILEEEGEVVVVEDVPKVEEKPKKGKGAGKGKKK